MLDMDFNTAEKTQGSLIPDGTRAHVFLTIQAGKAGPEGLYSKSQNDLYFLTFEATVMGGEYDKRKLWTRLLIGSVNGELTEGQQKGVDISRRMLRSMVEALNQISPVDDSPAALEKRKLKSLKVLDQVELEVVIGVEKNKDPKYDDKNIIKKVINPIKDKGEGSTARSAEPAKATASRSKWG